MERNEYFRWLFAFLLLITLSFSLRPTLPKTDFSQNQLPPLIIQKWLNTSELSLNLEGLQGKVVLLKFWASW